MAELQTDIEAMRRAFFRAVRLTAAIRLPASAGMAWSTTTWPETRPMLAATAAMAAVVLLLREIIFAGRTEPPLVELVLLTVAGAVIYLGPLFTLQRTVIGEGAEVLVTVSIECCANAEPVSIVRHTSVHRGVEEHHEVQSGASASEDIGKTAIM
jgi:hypothetical protein